jgi:hypothetical protein
MSLQKPDHRLVFSDDLEDSFNQGELEAII